MNLKDFIAANHIYIKPKVLRNGGVALTFYRDEKKYVTELTKKQYDNLSHDVTLQRKIIKQIKMNIL